ncbi:unnamed protein product [Calypogeia fissa]
MQQGRTTSSQAEAVLGIRGERALVETHVAPAEKEEEDLPKYCQDHSIYTHFYSDSGFLGIADVIDRLKGEIFKLPGVSELWNKNFLVRKRSESSTRMECPVNFFDYSTNLIQSVQVERDHGEYMRRSRLEGFVKLPWLLGSTDDDLCVGSHSELGRDHVVNVDTGGRGQVVPQLH